MDINYYSNMEKSGVKKVSLVALTGLTVNLCLSAFKITAGSMGNSRAVVADGIHSLTDIITDLVVLVGVRFWSVPPNKSHPYGYKRLESLISLCIGSLMAFVGAAIAYDAITHLREPSQEHVGSLLALSAALVSIVSKEALYRWTIHKARLLKSTALKAAAWHHRSDALSSIPAALAVSLALWFPVLAFVDLIGALVIAAFIIFSAWRICKPAINVLLDKGANPELHARIIVFAEQMPGVETVPVLRSRYLGEELCLEVHICVDSNISILEAHLIASQLQMAFYAPETTNMLGVEIIDAIIYVGPCAPDYLEINALFLQQV